jgi:hypothetical protein
MFRPLSGLHQADIQNILGSVHIIYGREILLLQIMLQVQFLVLSISRLKFVKMAFKVFKLKS